MVGEPSHVKQLSLNHVCKIGLIVCSNVYIQNSELPQVEWLKELGFDHAFNYKKVTVRKVMFQVFLM